MNVSSKLDTTEWKIRKLGPADLEDCHGLSSEAGWNQTRDDWKFIIENAETLGVERIGTGIVATTVAFSRIWTRWIAMVLTGKAWRGNGLASQLLQCFNVSKSDPVDYLDATSDGAPLYERCGFVSTGKIIRYKGPGQDPHAGNKRLSQVREISSSEQLVKLSNIWEKEASEAVWCPAAKTYFLNTFSRGCLATNSLENLGAIWARPGRLAWQVGPLVGASFVDAERLLDACLSTLAGDVFIDVPEAMESMNDCLVKRGFVPVREFLRMRCGPERHPRVPRMKRWATAGPEFG